MNPERRKNGGKLIMSRSPESTAKQRAWIKRYAQTPEGKKAIKLAQSTVRQKALKNARQRTLAYRLKTHRRQDIIPAPTRPCPLVCECCGNPPSKLALNVDHCHVTGVFRGWLCTRCNVGIGALGDNAAGLIRALEYLRKTGADLL
jgi:hypothetical protein